MIAADKPPLKEAYLSHISMRPWSSYKESDYTPEQWHNACLIHLHEGPPTAKGQCKLPVRTPNGALNKNAVYAAAAALNGARGGVNASEQQKDAARQALIRFYGVLGEAPPKTLNHSAPNDLLFFENRSTPKVLARGKKFDAPESYGKLTLRRPATEEEEKIIARGDWLRVDQKGHKGGEPGYKKTRMPGRQHLVQSVMDGDADDILEHYGVKGMKWGQRKSDDGGFRLQASGPKIDSSLHASNQQGAKEVAALVKARYGFEITEVKDLKINNKAEYDYGTVGYVQSTPGKQGGVVFIKPEDNRKDLQAAEKSGWFAPGTGNVRAFVTHESAHAMFHAPQAYQRTGFLGLGGKKVVGGNIDAREAALEAGTKQAAKDGIPPTETIGRVSGYAKAAGNREELEAELFSQYHWSPNPPNFVKAWGETLHRELGVDSTPFREVVNRG